MPQLRRARRRRAARRWAGGCGAIGAELCPEAAHRNEEVTSRDEGARVVRLGENVERGVLEAQSGHDRGGEQAELEPCARGIELAAKPRAHRFLAAGFGFGGWAKTSR
jgi:hypothetical protein